MAATEAFHTHVKPGPPGQRFCLWHADATRPPRALVVHVHAFAEEMNKSRRMVALQSRQLAEAGCAVWRLDLLGCGDSAGEFSDASWAAWVEDVVASVSLARARFATTWPEAPAPVLWLWGQRVGALLAAEAAQALGEPVNLLFWQATLAGKQALQQFLRLETVAALMGKVEPSAQPSGGKNLGARAALTRGEVAEIAGYGLAPGLASGLEAAKLRPPSIPARLVWLELAAMAGQAASPAVQGALDAWSQADWQVTHETCVGPSFWQTTEIEEAPALLQATVQAMQLHRLASDTACADEASAARHPATRSQVTT